MLIGELSARSGVSSRSLRYYEERGLLESRRSGNGYRDYEEGAVQRAATIHLLFGMGLPREVVSSVLTCSGPEAPRTAHDDLVARLPEVLADLDGRMAAMQATRTAIAGFLAARGA